MYLDRCIRTSIWYTIMHLTKSTKINATWKSQHANMLYQNAEAVFTEQWPVQSTEAMSYWPKRHVCLGPSVSHLIWCVPSTFKNSSLSALQYNTHGNSTVVTSTSRWSAPSEILRQLSYFHSNFSVEAFELTSATTKRVRTIRTYLHWILACNCLPLVDAKIDF
jgi:hypothetical protein